MQKVFVTITLEMEVPDKWEPVRTPDGIEVMDLGSGQYMDLAVQPVFATDLGGVWESSSEISFVNLILDMVTAEQVTYEMAQSAA